MALRRTWAGLGRDGDPRRWLAAVAALGLAARLAWLGRRAVHFDEARVGVEMLAYLGTGMWRYYPALHGPFLFHADRELFALLGPSDAVLRLPVALVGGLLPLAAWLYRDHLADAEVVALGVVLAANPLLLYYGRFARSDLPVAAFMVVALGCWFRLRATGRARYLYAGTAALAFGLASKENALLYLLSWAGAALVLETARRDRPWWHAVRQHPGQRRRWLGHAGLATLALLGLLTLLYAPRGGDGPGPGRLLTYPDGLAVVEAATVGPARQLLAIWVYGGGHPPAVYAAFLARLVGLLLVTSLPLVALAAVGTAVEWRRAGRPGAGMDGSRVGALRRLATRPRYLVAFSLLWAASGVVGYPLASDLVAAWTVVHVVVPLAVPAAVGLAATWDLARSAADARTRRLAAAGVVLSAALVGGLAGWSSYAAPGAPYNPFGQPGQAEADLRGTTGVVERVAAANDGTDVAYVGDFYGTRTWRLPFAWYLDPAGVSSTARSLPLEDPPPVVIAPDVHADELGPQLAGYVCVEHDPYPWGPHKPGGRATETVVYVDRAALDAVGSRWRPASACGPGLEAGDRPLLRLLAGPGSVTDPTGTR